MLSRFNSTLGILMLCLLAVAASPRIGPQAEKKPSSVQTPRGESPADADSLKRRVIEHAKKFYGLKSFKLSSIQEAAVGYTARGVITYEADDSELELEEKPCVGKMATFKKPYSKEKKSQLLCHGKPCDEYEVVQK